MTTTNDKHAPYSLFQGEDGFSILAWIDPDLLEMLPDDDEDEDGNGK